MSTQASLSTIVTLEAMTAERDALRVEVNVLHGVIVEKNAELEQTKLRITGLENELRISKRNNEIISEALNACMMCLKEYINREDPSILSRLGLA